MRQSILLGRKHGQGESLSVIAGPGIPHAINSDYKSLLGSPGEYEEIQIWDSGYGRIKRKTFAQKPSSVKNPVAADLGGKAVPEVSTGEASLLPSEDGPTLGGPSRHKKTR